MVSAALVVGVFCDPASAGQHGGLVVLGDLDAAVLADVARGLGRGASLGVAAPLDAVFFVGTPLERLQLLRW